jgi:hypothetical protein
MDEIKPKYNVTLAGQNLVLQFDVNSNPTKKGIKMQFVLPDPNVDPRVKQEIATKISTALQKRYGDAGIMIDYDTQTPYRNVIGFVIPLNNISNFLVDMLKGR